MGVGGRKRRENGPISNNNIRDRQTGRDRQRQAERQRHRDRDREIQRKTERNRDTERAKDRDRQTGPDTERTTGLQVKEQERSLKNKNKKKESNYSPEILERETQ